MFVGQLGVSSTLLSWTKKNPKGNLVHYPEEDVRIG
jgi:Trk-type K+ transport system membrane component